MNGIYHSVRVPGANVTPIRLLIVVGALVAAIAAITPTAHARTACVDRILDEWVNPSKPIATTHALKCYDLALKEASGRRAALHQLRDRRARGQVGSDPPESQRGTEGECEPESCAIAAELAHVAAVAPSAPVEPSIEPSPPPPETLEELPAPELVLEPDSSLDDPVAVAGVDPLAVDEAPQAEDVVPIDDPAEIQVVESEAVDAPVIDILRNIGPDDASSVPVPLIVLTILSGILAIIGGTLLAARHVQSRRMAEGPPLPPRQPGLRDSDIDI